MNPLTHCFCTASTGKEPESLTDWMLKEKAKGHVGRDLLRKGHRMMKAKDPKWYTDESPLDY